MVAKAGDVQFNFYSDDGFTFGIAGGATPVVGLNTVNVNGMPAVSNLVDVTWQLPSASSGGTSGAANCTTACPVITNVTPNDGIKVTKPVPVTASIQPSAGQTITSWKVTYQALDPEQPVTIASGAVTARYRYDSFGRPLAGNGPETGYTYAAAQYDPASGGGGQNRPVLRRLENRRDHELMDC